MKRKIIIVMIVLTVYMFIASVHEQIVHDDLRESQYPLTLWVLTEETTLDGMNHQARVLGDQFEAEHKNISIRLDILPAYGEERETYLKQIRTQIMAGEGPDVFLLPVNNVLTIEHPIKYTSLRIEPLFQDVEQAMHNGLFADISSFFDIDKGLGKDALNKEVMNAGIIGEKRYVLPLRFDFPVIYAFTDDVKACGLNISGLKHSFTEAAASVLEIGNPELASGLKYMGFNVFTNWINYEKGIVDLTSAEIYDYLIQYQELQTMTKDNNEYRGTLRLTSYIWGMEKLGDKWFPLYTGHLHNALDFAAIAEIENKKLEMIPLRSDKGDIIADVTYIAAVGAGCETPKLAYEFIRLFLLEESQWEINRLLPETEQHIGLVESGWPVRTEGSVSVLWENYRKQHTNKYADADGRRARQSMVVGLRLTDEDVPVLEEKIDYVRFTITLSDSLRDLVSSLNSVQIRQPTNADICALAEKIRKDLWWHLAEG